MTKETRLIIDIKDIIRLRYQCRNPECKQEILYRLDRNDGLKERCPFCGREWIRPRFQEERPDPRAALLKLLRSILAQENEANVTPKLEIELTEDLFLWNNPPNSLK